MTTLFEIICQCGQEIMLAQTAEWSPHRGTFFGSCKCGRVWEVREISGGIEFWEPEPDECPKHLQYYTA